MTIKEIAFKVEKLQAQSEKVDSLSAALFSAIYEGNSSADSYEWAFVLLEDVTHELAEQLNKMTEELFEIIKQKGSVCDE